MDSGPVQALQLRDQPQPASAATGSAAANGAGLGLHVTASAFPWPPGRARSWPASPEGAARPVGWPRIRDPRLEAADAKQVHGAGKIASRRKTYLSGAYLNTAPCQAAAVPWQEWGKVGNLRPSWVYPFDSNSDIKT